MSIEAAGTSMVTEAERERLTGYLTETEERVIDRVTNLTRAQWQFTPRLGAWSIADTIEHLIVAEQTALERAEHATAERSARPAEPDRRGRDAAIVARLAGRAARATTAPILEPAGRWSVDELLTRFKAGRARMLRFARAMPPDVRAYAAEHPILGALDGYQWALLTAAHTDRHLQQIDEIRADASFPS
jgi:hypothetical protein